MTEFLIWAAVYLVIGFPILRDAVRNIFHGDIFDENFLMVVATLGAFALQEYDEAVMVMLLYRIGEFFQDRAVDKSRRAITDLMDIRPDTANVLRGDDFVTVEPKELVVGDIILIKAGERIPADAVVVEGSSRVDCAAITGESMPADVAADSELYSGSLNLDGALRARVTAAAADSTAARILDLVENAAASRAKAEKFITKFARVYTPIVCGLALVLAVLPPLVGLGDWKTWIYRGLTFLLVACPCALVISIPLGFFAGIGAASSRGILVKGGNYLEALSKVKTMVYDKTGTLTKGVFKVVAVHPHAFSEEKLLELAAHCESFSNHPISRSLADAYGKPVNKAIVTEVHETAGKGIEGLVDGLKIVCGNAKMMEAVGVTPHECEIPGTVVHVVIEGAYAGHITISDVEKDDAREALVTLKQLGIQKNVMLTGDKEAVAAVVAKDLGVDEYHADLMPQDKVSAVEKIKAALPAEEKIAFVGDGINDAPVLTLADIGIAMGGMGSAAAVEAADIVLMNDKPSDIAMALRIAKKTMQVIRQNIYGSIGIKVAVLILTVFGISNMWLALFADVGVCLLAVLNSMRALRP